MSNNEIAIRTAAELDEKKAWSTAMAGGDMLPRQYRGNPANLLFAVEYADALGIPRINALTSIHVIDGKPTASADLIAGLVRKAGHKLRVEGDDTYATAQIIRADDPDYEPTPVRWDEAKARKAGRWGSKGPWTNYPGAMLRSRAITEAARMWASDALYGVIYSSEELGAVVDQDGNVVANAQPGQRVGGRPAVNERPAAAVSAADIIGTPEPVDAETVAVDLESVMLAAAELGTYADLLALYGKHQPNLTAAQDKELKAFLKARKEQLDSAAAQATADEAALDDAHAAELPLEGELVEDVA